MERLRVDVDGRIAGGVEGGVESVIETIHKNRARIRRTVDEVSRHLSRVSGGKRWRVSYDKYDAELKRIVQGLEVEDAPTAEGMPAHLPGGRRPNRAADGYTHLLNFR